MVLMFGSKPIIKACTSGGDYVISSLRVGSRGLFSLALKHRHKPTYADAVRC